MKTFIVSFPNFFVSLPNLCKGSERVTDSYKMSSVKNGTPISQVDGENLKRDYARMVVLIEDQLVEYKAGVQSVLFKGKPLKEWYKVGVEVTELSDLLLVDLKVVCNDLEKALPQDADRLKREHDKYYVQKIPELVELRRICNLKSVCEVYNLTGYAVLSPHPKTEADGMKFSKKGNKQCTTD